MILLFCNKCVVVNYFSGLWEGAVLFQCSGELRPCIPARSERHLTLKSEDTVFSLGLPEGIVNCSVMHVTESMPPGSSLVGLQPHHD